MPRFPSVGTVQQLQHQLSPARWSARVARAQERLAVVQALRSASPQGPPSKAVIRTVAPRVAVTTARRWWRWYHEREGAEWERLLDRRLPDKPWQTPTSWQRLIVALGRVEPALSYGQLRAVLEAEFGTRARLSESTLRRILLTAGLTVRGREGCPTVAVAPYGAEAPAPSAVDPGSERPGSGGSANAALARAAASTVTELTGGGGLVVLLAAMLESGVLSAMAEGLGQRGAEQTAPMPVVEVIAGRDEQGHFSAAYNRNRLAGYADEAGLFSSVAGQRAGKDLRRLRIVQLSVETLEQHLRCLVALPLLSERRGTAGLDGPMGAWLEVLSPVAYQAATLAKTLNELKWLDAAAVLWDCHAQVWWQCSQRWAGTGWRQQVCYVDSSQDPWWTQRFAQSGRVSRTGRVQPCLSRVVLSSGPGVPIIAEVHSGQRALDTALFDLLARGEQVLGAGALGRLTVVDAESCHLAPLRRFAKDPERDVITVLKGPLARAKSVIPTGLWQGYRERDQLREAEVNLEPRQADGLCLRVVEMRRPGCRQSPPTRFLTTASTAMLTTREVADAYLSRWPYQEDLFRRGRDGAGLARSHGYGVAQVANLALIDKRERAAVQQQRAEQAYHEAAEAHARATSQLAAAEQRLAQRRQTQPETLTGRHTLGVRQARQRLKACQGQYQAAERHQRDTQQQHQKLLDTPDEIYVRDTALDAVTTCLKLTLLALLEFICQEYLDQYRLMPRTFIEAWLALPVTRREESDQVLYEIAPNPRDSTMTQRLAKALEQINQRQLCLDGRRLVVRLRDGPD